MISHFVRRTSTESRSQQNSDKALSGEIKAIQAELKVLRNDLSKIQKNQKNVIPQINDNFVQLGKRVTSLEKRINRAEKSRSNTEKENEQTQSVVEAPVCVKIEEPNSRGEEPLYLKNFRDGLLMECTESDAQFKAIDVSDSKASFLFCGDVATAIATKDATFTGVCELIGWYNEARSLSMVSEGVVRPYSEGKWEVVKMAQIKCE